MEGVTPTTRYRKNGKKAYKLRGSGPMRARSGRSDGVPAGKSKSRSQQSADSRQNITNDQQQYTPVQNCAPPVIDHPSLSPCTPDCHQPLPESLCNLGSSFVDTREQCADEKSVQMDDGGMVYLDEHEYYGDRYPYVWTNTQYY